MTIANIFRKTIWEIHKRKINHEIAQIRVKKFYASYETM